MAVASKSKPDYSPPWNSLLNMNCCLRFSEPVMLECLSPRTSGNCFLKGPSRPHGLEDLPCESPEHERELLLAHAFLQDTGPGLALCCFLKRCSLYLELICYWPPAFEHGEGRESIPWGFSGTQQGHPWKVTQAGFRWPSRILQPLMFVGLCASVRL